MFSRVVVAIVFLCVLASQVFALSCFTYQGSVAFGGAVTGTCSAFLSAQIAAFGTLSPGDAATLTASIDSTSGPNAPGVLGQHCVIDIFNSGALLETSGGTAVSGACPDNGCAANSGQSFTLAGSPPASGAICSSDGCGYTPTMSSVRTVQRAFSSGSITLYNAVASGSSCSPGSSPPAVGQATDNGVANSTCAAAAGTITCATQDTVAKNCGTYNGDQVCVSDLKPGHCEAFASGGVACGQVPNTSALAVSPPAPNNGTVGVAAMATGTVTAGGALGGANYYAPAVVAASVGVVAGGAGTTTTPTGGAVGGSGSGTAPTAPVSKDCAFLGTCVPTDLPAVPEVNDVQTAGNNYMAAINSAPLVQAFSNISASIPAGTCPAPSFTIWGHEFTMDASCVIFNQLSAVLSAICLICYVIMGARILMSA
jgi:hypothetical protein